MKISIITISYNSSNTIKETLKSVQSQIYSNIEHIIIDGNSTDNTLKICKDFNHISKIISEPDQGVYDAFNKGLTIATGDIIGFLNSDDIFHNENSLKEIYDAFDEKTDCIYGDLIYTDYNEKVKRVWKGSDFVTGAFKKGWMPAHPTFYCRKSVYDNLGFYADTFKIAGDFELMLRFFEKHKVSSKYIPQILINMKIGRLSNNNIKSKIDILIEELKAFKMNKISINKFSYIFYKALKIKEFLIALY